MNEYLKDDAKNIICLPFRIAVFIEQCKLEDKIVEDISQISEFGFVAWDLLLAIYESGWDKLTANKDNRSFKQYVSA